MRHTRCPPLGGINLLATKTQKKGEGPPWQVAPQAAAPPKRCSVFRQPLSSSAAWWGGGVGTQSKQIRKAVQNAD